MTTANPDTSVVVIGAGQAGLSVSYYLKRLGLEPGEEFVVLDRGPGSGGAWQNRWDSLRIGSAHRINDLPGMDALGLSFETADRHQSAKDVVADYYRQYEDFYNLQVVRPAAVTRVENQGANLLVMMTDDEGVQTVTTDIVINATGTWGSPFVPWYPGLRSFEGRHVHTTEYKDAEDFAGEKVVVVGGGTSAIGFLLELENVAGELVWVTRRPVDFREQGELDLEARVSAVAMQDEAARAGRALPSIVSGTGVPRTRRIQAGVDRGVLIPRPMFAMIEPRGVRWADGSFQEADAIIWSTGFRPELRHLAPLKLREKEGGVVVAAGTSWKDPRVFFAGYGPQASTIGANRAGRMIARQAVATLSRMKREERESRDEHELLEREAEAAQKRRMENPPVVERDANGHGTSMQGELRDGAGAAGSFSPATADVAGAVEPAFSAELDAHEVDAAELDAHELDAAEVDTTELEAFVLEQSALEYFETADGELPNDELPNDELPNDELPNDELPNDELPEVERAAPAAPEPATAAPAEPELVVPVTTAPVLIPLLLPPLAASLDAEVTETLAQVSGIRRPASSVHDYFDDDLDDSDLDGGFGAGAGAGAGADADAAGDPAPARTWTARKLPSFDDLMNPESQGD